MIGTTKMPKRLWVALNNSSKDASLHYYVAEDDLRKLFDNVDSDEVLIGEYKFVALKKASMGGPAVVDYKPKRKR